MANTSAAIVAIPAPLEPIRLVGDEDKHATLLFFGETATLPVDALQMIKDAVELASSMLSGFNERIVDVSRLGSDTPPALVAMLSDRCMSQIRNLFLMNPDIKGYLDNTQQFPNFTPHMTLGYPDYTQETILRSLARNLYSVSFDRLAVWWNDERFEFPLGRLFSGSGDDAVAAMSQAIAEFLDHADVKTSETVSDKPWSNFKESDYTDEQWLRACLIDRGGDATAKQRASLPVREPDGTLNKNAVHAAAGALAGARGGLKDVSSELKAKAARALVRLYGVLGETPPSGVDGLAHSDDADGIKSIVEATIADAQQHGIKGMKWGVRRPRDSSTGLVARASSADQIHQDRIAKKISTHGASSLSNKDIQDFTRRLQLHSDLERTLAQRSAADKAKTDGFIKSFIKKQTGRQFDRVVNKALDVAVEKALKEAGLKLGKKGANPDIADLLVKTSSRLAPKKGK